MAVFPPVLRLTSLLTSITLPLILVSLPHSLRRNLTTSTFLTWLLSHGCSSNDSIRSSPLAGTQLRRRHKRTTTGDRSGSDIDTSKACWPLYGDVDLELSRVSDGPAACQDFGEHSLLGGAEARLAHRLQMPYHRGILTRHEALRC